jgi:hypothetical protein
MGAAEARAGPIPTTARTVIIDEKRFEMRHLRLAGYQSSVCQRLICRSQFPRCNRTAMVQYVLDDKSRQIFASRYQSQLPSEETLKNQIERELKALRDEG